MVDDPTDEMLLAELKQRAATINEIDPVRNEKGTLSRTPRAFVSYSRRDRQNPLLRALVQDLRSLFGIEVWMDVDEIHVGDSVLEKITAGIHRADFILHIISAHSSVQLWPRQEFELAYSSQLNERRAKILPIKIDDGPTPSYLQSLRVFDLSMDYAAALRDLAVILTADRRQALATFAVDYAVDRKTIIDVSDRVGRAMIDYFAKHPDEMRRMDRRKFEEMVAELFVGFGYAVELTAKTRDGGRDVIAIKRAEVNVKYLIECKRPNAGGYVGVRPVRELYGVKAHEGATKAILATTAYFSQDALLFFEEHQWELEPRAYDGILDWIAEYRKQQDHITVR
jgi:hypothetical protein